MKTLLLFLLIPLNAMSADMCVELKKYYASFEKELASKTVSKDCKSFTLPETAENKILLEVETERSVYKENEEDKDKLRNLFDLVKCKDISFLENRMRDVESQLNTIMGFKKLVDTITNAKTDIVIDKKVDKDEMDAFVTDVSTAALLETFTDNPTFFKFLSLDDLKDPSTYKAGVEKHCLNDDVKKLKLTELCKSLTAKEISSSSLTSMRVLLTTYKMAKDDKSKSDLVSTWQKELAINKDDGDKDDTNDEEYSFVELNNELQGKPLVTMSDRLKVIKSTTPIKHFVPKNATIDDLFKRITSHQLKAKQSVEVRRLVTAHNDLHERQVAERESRLSLLWLEFKPTGSTETDDKRRIEILQKVLEDLYKGKSAQAEQGRHLSDALRAINATQEQVKNLKDVTECLDLDKISKDSIKDACQKTLSRDTFDDQTLKLNNELKLLTTIHNTILDKDLNPANLKLVRMKQLAMEALKMNKCTKTEMQSSLTDCKIEGVINPEMENILINGLDVSLMFLQPTSDELEDANEICNGSDKSQYNAFCELAKKGLSKFKRPDHSKESVTGPMSPESRDNPMREALLNGARNLAVQVGQMFQQPKMPYYMNNNTNRYGPPSPTISQYLIGTSVASGQLRPYTSVTQQQNFFAYKPLR